MKTLHVGGINPVNRHKTFEDALTKAKDDDTIEIHKNITISTEITKDIIIDGKNNIVNIEQGKAGIITNKPIEIKNIRFSVNPRSNAILATSNIAMTNITVELVGPIREFYPIIKVRPAVDSDGNLLNHPKVDINNCNLIMLDIAAGVTSTINETQLESYYKGDIMLSTREDMNVINGNSTFNGCKLKSTLIHGKTTLNQCEICKFVDITANATLNRCELNSGNSTGKEINTKKLYKKEPQSGPLSKQTNNRYSLAIQSGAEVTIIDYTPLQIGEHYLGIYVENSIVSIKDTQNQTNTVTNLVQDSTISYSNTNDQNYWELTNSTSAYVRSVINSNDDHIPAKEKLMNLIGQDVVKDQVTSIMNTIEMNRNTTNSDFDFSYNMIFAGSPGTGKSTIAEIVAEALFEIGAIRQNKLTSATSDDFVKGYVGQTGENTRKILERALGGVLFIDEAYELTVKDGVNSFNSEVISVLIRFMEKHRNDLVVIAAGYDKEMKEFLSSNAGLPRRFQWIQFNDYTVDELSRIFEQIRYSYDDHYEQPELKNLISPLFDRLTHLNLSIPDAKGRITNGGNGGLVRNVYQQIVQARNNRVMSTGGTSNFTKEDIAIGFKTEMNKAEQRRL